MSTTFDIDRRTGIGASEAAAVLGLDRFATAADIWARKVGEEAEPDESWPMKLGSLFEPLVAKLYTERTGIAARRHTRAFFDPIYPFLYSHVDRWNRDRVVEIKTTARPGDEWGPDGSQDVPLPVMVQTTLQMRHSGRRKADVAALLYGRDLRVYPLEYDPEIGQQLADRLAAFWHDHVEAKVQPPLDGSDAARAYLTRRYPADAGDERALMPSELPMITRLLAARADHERTAAERQEAENAIKEFMGATATLSWDGGRITWRTSTRQDTAWQRVAEWLAEALKRDANLSEDGPFTDAHYAELVAGNTTPKSSRTFNVHQERNR